MLKDKLNSAIEHGYCNFLVQICHCGSDITRVLFRRATLAIAQQRSWICTKVFASQLLHMLACVMLLVGILIIFACNTDVITSSPTIINK